MWTHKLYRTGGSLMVTIPRDVAKEWDRRGAVFARIVYTPPTVRIEPYTRELQPCYPADVTLEATAHGRSDDRA